MSDRTGPVYEVTHTVDADIAGDFDRWLAEHVERMLEIPGVEDARVYVADGDDEKIVRRVTQYFFDSESGLETYLAEHAAAMRRSADETFAGRFEVSRRVLRGAGDAGAAEPGGVKCLNCGSPLTGQYCGNCGQRARSRLISIWELLRDAFGDLFELDSRLWQTLVPLMISPGSLTKHYLEGRRARFMPPFRTYLVLSILFFVVAFFDPREQFDVFFDEAPAVAGESADSPTADEIVNEVREELVAEGVLGEDPRTAEPAPQGDGAADVDEESDGFNIRITDTGTESSGDCDNLEVENTPPWLASWLTQERLKVICERTTADGGKAFASRLLDTTPSALIFLLPHDGLRPEAALSIVAPLLCRASAIRRSLPRIRIPDPDAADSVQPHDHRSVAARIRFGRRGGGCGLLRTNLLVQGHAPCLRSGLAAQFPEIHDARVQLFYRARHDYRLHGTSMPPSRSDPVASNLSGLSVKRLSRTATATRISGPSPLEGDPESSRSYRPWQEIR